MFRARPEDDYDERGARRLNADYAALARDHAQRRRFARDLASGLFAGSLCVLCREREPATVFFPCEHRCVCDACLAAHAIGPPHSRTCARPTSGAPPEAPPPLPQERRVQEQHQAQEQHRQQEQRREQDQQPKPQPQQQQHEECWPFCPLCLQEIRLALPSDAGAEVEQYWRWIHEVSPRCAFRPADGRRVGRRLTDFCWRSQSKPRLPSGFEHRFARQSRIQLELEHERMHPSSLACGII
jgi:hypothetical protein